MKIYHYGLVFRLGSLWVGGHWSDENKRLCFNLIPCFTFWAIGQGGTVPRCGRDIFRKHISIPKRFGFRGMK